MASLQELGLSLQAQNEEMLCIDVKLCTVGR